MAGACGASTCDSNGHAAAAVADRWSDMTTTDPGGDEPSPAPATAAEPAGTPAAAPALTPPTRKKRKPATLRREIIERMFHILDMQVRDLEEEINEMHSEKRRAGEKELVLLNKIAGNLDKLITLDPAPPTTARRRTKQMEDLRSRLIERIEQLKRP